MTTELPEHMDNPNDLGPLALVSSAGLGQADPKRAKPRAWAIFVDSGNARMWSTLQPHVQKLADAEGLEVTPLYDQAALDAAVAAERDRFRSAALTKLPTLDPAWPEGVRAAWHGCFDALRNLEA